MGQVGAVQRVVLRVVLADELMNLRDLLALGQNLDLASETTGGPSFSRA
jgi:hypothetical protein